MTDPLSRVFLKREIEISWFSEEKFEYISRRSAIAKKQHNASSRRFEKFESVHSLSLSRHDCMYLQKLTLCEECYKDLLPHILIDLIGEEFDNLVDIDDEKEEELEDINVSLKHISNFWNGRQN